MALAVCGPACPKPVDLALQQLNHKGWTVADGVPGAIYAIAQTADGTLWLGGPSGLSRFDGISFVRFDGTRGLPAESRDIKTLTAAPDGSLWIGYAIGGISVLRGGVALHYDARDGLPRGSVNNIVMDGAGVTYAATSRGLYQLRGSRWLTIVLEPDNPTERVAAMKLDRAGTLWVVTERQLWARRAGQADFLPIASRGNPRRIGANALAAGSDGTMWVLHFNRMGGLTRVGTTQEIVFPDVTTNPGMEFDRNGNLWVGGAAIRRFPAAALAADPREAAQQMEVFTQADGLTGGSVNCFFEDREGNMWAGTYAGLDRFTHSNILRVTSANTFGAAAAGESGSVWVSTAASGSDTDTSILELRTGNVVNRYLAPDFTSAYRAPNGTVWFGGTSGIVRFEPGLRRTIPLPEQGEVQTMVADNTGGMWVSIAGKSVFRLVNGRWAGRGDLPTLPEAPPFSALADNHGSVWLGYTDDQLARIDGPNVRMYGRADGLDVGNIISIAARQQDVWIGGDRGLAHFDGTRFVPISSDSDNPFSGISGIVALKGGDLWLNGNLGVLHISRLELERAARDPQYRVHVERFDRLDGLKGYARQVRPSPSAFEGTDGRVWFATQLGLVAIDPSRIGRNTLPPPVTIWSIDGKSVQYPAVVLPRLPVHTTSVRIEYTAASLSVPERVQFRYKLDGADVGWQDAGARREATYTNLGPGQYSFHVIASNNDGVWNNTGASLSFAIAPAFYQTRWFYGLCALACLMVLRLLYVLRIRQVTAQLHGRLEERLAERERIARELHDTLLQSVQGLVLRFRAAVSRLPQQEPARPALEKALDRADDVLIEGRDRVKYIRSSPSGDLDLPQAIAATGEELAAEQPARFRSTVEGAPRTLHPIVREEAMFIAREALTNAFRHSGARQIEAEVSYGHSELRVRIRDDGRGIDVDVVREGGREGHWGLLGMRERAKKIHATLTVWSRPGAGTEIDVHLPAHIAYAPRKGAIRRESLVSPLS